MGRLSVERFSEGAAFRAAAEAFLRRDEARNNLFLGLTDRFGLSGAAGVGAGYVVRGANGAPALVALRSDERGVTAGDGSPAAVLALADALLAELAADPARLKAANGPEVVVDLFAERWCARTGAHAEPRMRQRLHRLDAVSPLERVAAGALRAARGTEAPLLAGWVQGFCADAGMHPFPPGTVPQLAQGRLYVWEDGAPVAMAAWSRPTPRGASIGLVYTPPELRGRGYATALVAALSQRILDAGKAFCTLFTDLANPTSNHVYARIGYVPVADWRLVGFSGAASGRGAGRLPGT